MPAYSLPEDNNIASALLLRFRKQRQYWLQPDGTVVQRDGVPELEPGQLAE